MNTIPGLTTSDWMMIGLLAFIFLFVIVIEAIRIRADAAQMMRMHPTACPHGHLNWDDCPDCCH